MPWVRPRGTSRTPCLAVQWLGPVRVADGRLFPANSWIIAEPGPGRVRVVSDAVHRAAYDPAPDPHEEL